MPNFQNIHPGFQGSCPFFFFLFSFLCNTLHHLPVREDRSSTPTCCGLSSDNLGWLEGQASALCGLFLTSCRENRVQFLNAFLSSQCVRPLVTRLKYFHFYERHGVFIQLITFSELQSHPAKTQDIEVQGCNFKICMCRLPALLLHLVWLECWASYSLHSLQALPILSSKNSGMPVRLLIAF